MFYRHWLLLCFPEFHVDQVPVLLGPVQEGCIQHAVWIIAGAGDGPLHHLLLHWIQGLPRFSRRRLVYDQDAPVRKPFTLSSFRILNSELNAEVLHQASDTSTTDDDALDDTGSDHVSVEMWEVGENGVAWHTGLLGHISDS